MNFTIIESSIVRPKSGNNSAYLEIDRWNDYSFVTMFALSLHDCNGEFHHIGSVKIGFREQTEAQQTHATLEPIFSSLPIGYFSLGQDVEYYKNVFALPSDTKALILNGLNDVVNNPTLFADVCSENVFDTSLLRSVSKSAITEQFARVLRGEAPLTKYHFLYNREETEQMPHCSLEFIVTPNSKPSSNIHAIIGRNGVGKTTILNDMVKVITNPAASISHIYYAQSHASYRIIDNTYFSRLASVSFSAFDSFKPPCNSPDSDNIDYYYLGLKNIQGDSHEALGTLRRNIIEYMKLCFSQKVKKDRWLQAIGRLESDENFSEMELKQYQFINSPSSPELHAEVTEQIENMSSGHAVVLLIITFLVAYVEEKTLVLIDEPESHLHPPLLSGFIRALSDLLYDRNGVAIIATHSPVVLQEIPKSCVWKMNRVGNCASVDRPSRETFGENVGILTREIFGLEVFKSGFYDLLAESVSNGDDYDSIVEDYAGQLGTEARMLLQTLIANRDRKAIQ